MKTLILAFLLYGAATAAPESVDYIVVGAGTAGLVVANRLSEDPSVTVAVIEPGTDQRNNPNVTGTDKFSMAFGTAIDWQYTTTEQPGAGDRALQLHQGKAWGGTSTINGMTYIRAEAAQIDAWEKLGNPGWNWEALFPYFIKSENYTIPSDTQLVAGATYEPEYHGSEGPIHVGYPLSLSNGSFAQPVIQTWEGLSLSQNPDLNSGHLRGFGMGPQTLDRKLDRRWDAAQSYYYPVEDRSNLKIVQGTVKRMLWEEESLDQRSGADCRIVASGVEFLTEDGETDVLNAKKEVVISAGAVRTPLVLESSGIGNPRILESLGIETKVDLPSVGENFGDQPNHVISYSGELDPAWNAYHTFLTAADLFGDDLAAARESTRDSIPEFAQAAVDASADGGLNVSSVEKLLRIQHGLIFENNVTFAEILTVIAPGLHASNYWILLPFSRGSVHLGSADKINEPLIDPQFFLADFDLSATVATGKMAQKFWLSEPMKNFVTEQTEPGQDVLPDDATDKQWEQYAREYLAANSHGISTAAMMSKELGGVVDPEVRVYGTANVRVVDASIIPTQISGHTTATLYGVAEYAADIIKKTSR